MGGPRYAEIPQVHDPGRRISRKSAVVTQQFRILEVSGAAAYCLHSGSSTAILRAATVLIFLIAGLLYLLRFETRR
jgi:hypothetical protein